MCFGDTSITINENQGLVVSSILLSNLTSGDIIVTVITTDGTATGEV